MSSESLYRKPLTEQLYGKIKNRIITQEFKCGDKLNIDDLSRTYNVSITPIREAINRLKQEGLVEFVPNVGAKVFTLNLDILKNINEACYYYDILAINYMLDNNLTEEVISELENILSHQKEAYDMRDENMFYDYSIDFHELIINKIDNNILKKSIYQIRGQYNIAIRIFYSEGDYRGKSIDEHSEILIALKNKDIDKVHELLKVHYLNSFEEFKKNNNN